MLFVEALTATLGLRRSDDVAYSNHVLMSEIDEVIVEHIIPLNAQCQRQARHSPLHIPKSMFLPLIVD